jgi:hypothetical protein
MREKTESGYDLSFTSEDRELKSGKHESVIRRSSVGFEGAG